MGLIITKQGVACVTPHTRITELIVGDLLIPPYDELRSIKTVLTVFLGLGMESFVGHVPARAFGPNSGSI